MKFNACFRSLSLLTLLVVIGGTLPIQAQESGTMDQCHAFFGGDVDEFDGIELTEQQERAIATLDASFETQFEQGLTPEQRQQFEAIEERYEAGLATILTPEQQTLTENNALEEITLSPEQQTQLARLEEDLWRDSEVILNAQQADQFDTHEKNYEKQLATILTTEQQAQFERNQFAIEFPEFSDLQLTPEQYPQVRRITEEFTQKELSLLPEITQQQETQLIQLESRYEARIADILSPEQQQQWNNDSSSLQLSSEQEDQLAALDQDFETQLTAILPDLSEDQTTQLEQLEERYETQLNSVLTPSQQQQLDTNLSNLERLEEDCF